MREPRQVLSEFGTELEENVRVRVWDSSAEVRYLVLPQQPAEWLGLDEQTMVERITRNSMIGVERLA